MGLNKNSFSYIALGICLITYGLTLNAIPTNSLILSEQSYCTSNGNCKSGEVCVDLKCKCEANHKFNSSTGNCDYFICVNDTMCQTYDENRECYLADCRCKMGYEPDSNNKICILIKCNSTSDCGSDEYCASGTCHCHSNYYRDSSTHLCSYQSSPTSVWAWAWVFFVIALCVLIAIIFCITLKRMLDHHHSKNVV